RSPDCSTTRCADSSAPSATTGRPEPHGARASGDRTPPAPHEGRKPMGTTAPAHILVAGEWRAGNGAPIRSVNPFDGTVNAVVAAADASDVDEAVRRGDAAMRDPHWRGMPAHERARLLHRVGELITANRESLAQLQTRDNGKP